jgi:predicted HTH domain antitoxin
MVTIPEEYIRASRLSETEMLVEIAVMLFQKEKLTLGQAARLANMPQYQFQALLASRDISIHL